MRPAYLLVYQFSSGNHLPATIFTTSISYSKKLSNLVKIYTEDIKYYGCNNSFIFKLAIFYNISL